MRGIASEPAGLRHAQEFISVKDEVDLLEFVSSLVLTPITIRGNPSLRTAAHFGLRYDYGSRVLQRAAPVPPKLDSVIRRAEVFSGLAIGSVDEALVNRYPQGAGIGWHSDADVYRTIIGISLGGACTIQFRTKDSVERRVFELQLAARSIYVLSGPVQALWQHRIPTTTAERFSLTFRSLTGPRP
jgi:DNA oxidative demethylase